MAIMTNKQENEYYQLFCHRTAVDLAGFFPTDFWLRVALTEGHSEPTLRHAIVALGALTRSVLDNSDPPFGMIMPPTNTSVVHHEFALKQYHEAIVHLREVLSIGKQHIRTALVACLLFVAFENIHGDPEAAAKHMHCGLNLLDQWQAQCSSTQVEELQRDDVYQMFVRLNSQAYSHIGSELSWHPNPKLYYWNSVARKRADVPVMFTDIHSARWCWDVIMERTIDYHKMAGPHKYGLGPPPWVIEEADAIAIQLQIFEDTFWPLMNQLADEASPMENGAIVIYLANKLCAIFLQMSVVQGELPWDSFFQHFREIVERSRQVLERARRKPPNQQPQFAFELAIIAPIHMTALKCRDPYIRRQAISLLKTYPRREGCWDALLLAKLDTWIMQIEEEGMVELGFIPESSRWRLGEVRSTPKDRSIYVKLVQDSFDRDGQWCWGTDFRETHLSW